jgi:hypothetical protein
MCKPGAVSTAAGLFLILEPNLRYMPQLTAPSLMALVIEPDSASAFELSQWLADQPERPEVMLSTSVEAAEKCLRTQKIDWLFVRTRCWDHIQQMALSLPRRPRRVVFLSGRREKGTRSLHRTLDAHLRAPYLPEHLAKVWDRLSNPTFQPQPLDFFFLRVSGQLVTVRFGDLRQVHREGELLRVETRQADYLIKSNLIHFQDRLPIRLTPVRPGCLVNEAYQQSAPETTN